MLLAILLAHPFELRVVFSAVSLFFDHEHFAATFSDLLRVLPQLVLFPFRHPALDEYEVGVLWQTGQ